MEKADIPLLVEALQVPPIFKCYNGTISDGTEGLCIVLKRFAYSCRYSDMIPMFRRSLAELCMIGNEIGVRCGIAENWFYLFSILFRTRY